MSRGCPYKKSIENEFARHCHKMCVDTRGYSRNKPIKDILYQVRSNVLSLRQNPCEQQLLDERTTKDNTLYVCLRRSAFVLQGIIHVHS